MISVNARAWEITGKMLDEKEALGIGDIDLPNGTKVIDAGVHRPGSLAAGRYFAEICLGGLGDVSLIPVTTGDLWLPGVAVATDRPLEACMASQYAGWRISSGSFFAMASGPGRALALVEDVFRRLGYRDQSPVAVVALEGRAVLPVEVARYIARKCGVDGENLRIIVAPSASLAGSVQISARVVETGLHKMMELGFDLKKVVSGFGIAPLAPVAGDDLRAIGRCNDCVLYGGKVYYAVQAPDGDIEGIIRKIPSSSATDYGETFFDLFRRYGGDFYKIDPMLFSPAEVVINNLSSGRVFRAGGVNVEILKKSLMD